MNPLPIAWSDIHWSMPPLRFLIWPILFGVGAYLVLTSQPIGKPKPDLAERLRRLNVDERMRMHLAQRETRPIFALPWLEALLRPILDDLGRLTRGALSAVGLGGGDNLEQRLALLRPGVEPPQFFGEKVVAGLLGAGFFPLLNAVGLHPFGVWPIWISLIGLAVGFFAPDWDLRRRLAERQNDIVMELPTVLDMLTISTSAGMALEQALTLVARQGQGVVVQQLQQAVREMALGQYSLDQALAQVAERNQTPALTSLVGQLRASSEQGTPIIQSLQAQAESLREQKRLRIVEQGGKANVRMLFPVALFILPVLFVVLLIPAIFEMLRLAR